MKKLIEFDKEHCNQCGKRFTSDNYLYGCLTCKNCIEKNKKRLYGNKVEG